ncbi:wax ester/triacylglycerol synthase family O-acyltransferase [Pseudohalioglobus sediminis]|uniref:diacylglycerol O-acyltransferase n=1 Tax=Pseudohalioglobus sediminis TaxID=2606449 RepID=A0A5B0WNV3_9GAMM|nr:wax ester/triacylglycerol synthase family O-acyltransferase [Pseudohalioglobus sediminis]KAA1188456.1 wax ester/triacylglycerol synthase family O-acyltransferase [Pseudohalioglobus sediminis]
MQQLSGQDAMFLHAEIDGLPQHIGGVSIYDQSTAPGGKVRFKQILDMLERRLHLSPIFRRKLAFVPGGLGRPYWVEDPDFDLEYHVRHIALPKPGDWRQLCILTARIHSMPLRRDKPMWEMYVIEGLNNVEGYPRGCFGLLLKVHHCAMDGATGTQFMNIVHDLTPETRDPGNPPPWIVERPSKARMLGRAYLDAWRKPGQALDFIKESIPAALRIRRGSKAGSFHFIEDKPTTRFQGKISRHRVVGARKFDFEQVREIKNSVPGATINDAMLTIVSGAMRRYLEDKGELPDESLVTGCPIDVRSPEEKAAGGNMVGFMNVALCSDILDPAARLAAIHEESQNAKTYAEALGPRFAVDLTDVLPGNVLSLAVRTASATGLSEASVMFNTIVTNVPGAPYQLYMCGAALVDSISLGPLLPNVGLFQIVYSSVQNKKGSIVLSFTACREMMPDPEFYAKCLQASFDELYAATVRKTKKKKKPAAKKKRSRTKGTA